MRTVFLAGATGYLGRHLAREFTSRGWHVRALVRDAGRARAEELAATELVEAEATLPASVTGRLDGVDLVVSSLGLTRQRDGLGYREVDFQANANILDEALAAGVPRFGYVHVLGAERMLDVPLVAAKQAFVDRLRAAPIEASIIAPSGYFSDMEDFLAMARRGRVWLFGQGGHRLNPIHGADLAAATAAAIEAGQGRLDVGGPDVFTHAELAALAFDAIGQRPRITRLPDGLRRVALRALPWLAPRHIGGPARFFLTAMGIDMVGARRGHRHLADHFAALVAADGEPAAIT